MRRSRRSSRSPPIPVRERVFLPAFGAVLLTCLLPLAPGIPAGDSGELIAAAHVLGTAHPPGYPLWTLLAAAWERIIPFGSVAWRLNLFSAVTMALAAGAIAATVARLVRPPIAPGIRHAAAMAAAFTFAHAAPTWKYALVAEVFALNALLAAVALAAFVALLDRREAGARAAGPLAVLAAVGGLLVAHHHSLVLLWLPLAVAAAALAAGAGRARPSARELGLAAGAFALGLTPLAWLPWAAGRVPPAPLAWGDPVTPARFFHVLTRADYGTFQLASKESGLIGDRSHIAIYLEALPRDLAPWLLVLALVGLVALARDRRRRPLAIALAAFFALQLAFFTRVSFPTTPALYLGVVERFYILPAVAIAVATGAGVAAALAALARRNGPAWLVPLLGGVLVFGSTGLVHPDRMALFQRPTPRLVEDLADGVLASLPDSAVLFVQGDLFHNALAVRRLVEGARPDVALLDQELMTYPWYVARARRLYPGVLPPRLGAEDRYDGSPGTGNGAWIDHLRANRPARPAAFLGLKEASYAERYAMVPVGYVLWAMPKEAAPDPRAHAAAALDRFAGFRLDTAFLGYDPTSFEAMERARMTECLARTTRLLLAPSAFALTPATTPGFAALVATLERSRQASAARGNRVLPNPPEDPEVVRARGYLYALHPAARDSVRAEVDLASTLAREPAGTRADEARRVLAWLRQNPVAAAGALVP